MNVRWRPSFAVTAMHALAQVECGFSLVDASLEAALGPARAELGAIFPPGSRPPLLFWEHLCGSAAEIDNNRQLAEVTLSKSMGRSLNERHVLALARAISGVEAALSSAAPALETELDARLPLLREQWDAKGPGMMRIAGALTTPQMIVESAIVLLAAPVCGGGGAAHVLNNSVRLEAVLANAADDLPEMVRLGWLLAQLQIDLPVVRDAATQNWRQTAALAMAPATLAAALEVELLPVAEKKALAPEYLAYVLAAWPGAWASSATPGNVDAIAQRLAAWWATYRDTRLAWPMAVAALDQMLWEN